MIRFLKRRVWPWSEIERLRENRDAWREAAKFNDRSIDALLESDCELRQRLAKYERPRDGNGGGS